MAPLACCHLQIVAAAEGLLCLLETAKHEEELSTVAVAICLETHMFSFRVLMRQAHVVVQPVEEVALCCCRWATKRL